MTHVIRLGPVWVNSTGQIKIRSAMTIGEAATANSEIRVLPDASVPNSANYPTMAAYIIAEDIVGYKLAHIDQTFIVTQTANITFDKDIDIGDVHLLNTLDAKISPAITGEAASAASTVAAAVAIATEVSASVLYDGQLAADKSLAVAATETAFAALDVTPDPIALTTAVNAIRVWLMNSTAAQSGTLCVGQFDTGGNLIEVNEVTIPTTDQVFDTDRDAWGLTTATDYPAKHPVVATFKRHASTASLKLWMAGSLGGTWYARYQLLGSV